MGEKTNNDPSPDARARRHPAARPNTADRLNREMRIERILELLPTCSQREIARRLGLAPATITADLEVARQRLVEQNNETTEQMRALLTQQARDLFVKIGALVDKATAVLEDEGGIVGEDEEERSVSLTATAKMFDAIASHTRNLIAVNERLAKMHGIDSATQNVTVDINVQITGMIGHLHAAGMETIEELRALGKPPEMIEAAAEALDMARQKTAAKIEVGQPGGQRT
jgi:DNA-binding CsgD family transcriptional regulator